MALRHGCFPVNLLHIFKILFCKNNSGGLLQYVSDKSTSNVNSVFLTNVFMNSFLLNLDLKKEIMCNKRFVFFVVEENKYLLYDNFLKNTRLFYKQRQAEIGKKLSKC